MNSEIVRFKRLLKMALPKGQSAFLWGARKTGKSTYLHDHFPKAIFYDLLKTDLHFQLAKEPHLLREEILALPADATKHPIIIDEVQKIPELLNEIHWLIENTKFQFILCGSSARKLKRNAANLLGGRAWRYLFYPLVYPEIPHFNLLHALNNGLVPSHYLANDAKRSLNAYVTDYLKEEIQGESLVRNLPAFARFLDAMALTHGELVNFSNIARDCGIDSKTVKEYYQILEDTLLGYFIYPYTNRAKRDIILAMPKFYLFDVGVANALAKRKIASLKGIEAGKLFEHFILTELIAYRGLHDLDFDIRFWRTKTGLEVDFILGKAEVAIEIKISERIDKSEIKGLIAFQEEHRPKNTYLVCLTERPRKITTNNQSEILALPWETFLKKLWAGEIIK
ncbi:AAA family ATPase [Gammaproteobacteria bacterium SCGC AG-212-F23]|nr:AAA family ATPase [Gammaproteobacteria bacterium SCGC AG-212-F23]